jgi:mono/diheme cytochrome c family protein
MRARVGGRDSTLKLWLLLGAAAAAVLLWRIDGAAHPGISGVTWTGTAARLLEEHCAACHAQGGVRPRLDDYESARLASEAIKRAVLTRHLPRWYAEAGFGSFRNDPALTPHEVELIAQWADGRAPYGDPIAATAAAAPSVEPFDLTLRVAFRYRIQDATQTFTLPTGLTEDRSIRGWAFLPGNTPMITAAVLSLDSGSTLGTWVPGERATFLPAGVTQRLPAGAAVRVTVYYRPSPMPAVDASGVGLYFADRPDRELAHRALPCGAARVPQAIDVIAIRPSLGASARSLAIVARRPGGAVEPLARFQNFPADHPRTYWIQRALRLPRGTVIDVAAEQGTCSAELEYVRPGGPITMPASASRVMTAHAGSDKALVPYWCPMHATERATGPGRCPQCGMALVPVTPEVDGTYLLEARMGPPAGSTLRLVVREPRTDAIVLRFETVHERPFHLFLVSDDLEEFFHVHPVSRPDGSLEVSPAPLRSRPYHLYADFMPVGGTPQMIARAMAPGMKGGHAASSTLAPDLDAKTAGSIRVRMAIEDGVLIAGKPGLMAFHLEDAASGAPIADLQPYLGAWGHAFIVSGDMADAVHSHPLTPLSRRGGPTIVFQQRFPRPGPYRLWAQFMRGGRLSTVSFTVTVADAAPRP